MTDLSRLTDDELVRKMGYDLDVLDVELPPLARELRRRLAALAARIGELERAREQRCIAHGAVAVLNGDCPICDVVAAEAERDALKEALREYRDRVTADAEDSLRRFGVPTHLAPFQVALDLDGIIAALSSPVAEEDPGDPTDGLPPEVTRALRDQSIIVSRDAEVFEKIAEWQNAPSDTASADLPAPAEEEGA